MDYIDLKFSRLVSSYLKGWKDIGNGVVKFRCPFCGDSKKSSSKVRGYFYELQDRCIFKCHNCGASMNLYSFLTEIAPSLAKEYRFERFSNKEKKPVETFATNTEEVFGSRTLLDRFCLKITELDETHKARLYVNSRKIPSDFQDDLYYTENVLDIMNEIEEYKESASKMRSNEAIVIPFFSESGTLMCIQFRFLGETSMRYLTLKLTPTALKIWGLDRVDFNKRVYVCEGAFDAMFLPNSIAVAGASLLSMIKYLENKTNDFVLIFDKDYKVNYEIYVQLKKAIDAGHKVVMFDRLFEAKDINSQVQDYGWSMSQLREYVEKRTVSGLMAKLELTKFRPPRKRRYDEEIPKEQFKSL